MWFMDDLAERLANRVQLTATATKPIWTPLKARSARDIDFAQLVKLYGEAPDVSSGRYSPAECVGAVRCRSRQSRSRPHQHVLCRTGEPHDADAHAPVHAADERLFQEGREPRAFDGAVHDLLQFGPHP